MSDTWAEQAERAGGTELVRVISEVITGQKNLLEKMGNMEQRQIRSARSIERLISAFPAGDVEGHKRYHDMMIRSLDEKRRLRIAIQEKTISGLVWSIIVFAGVSIWKFILAAIKAQAG
jgi:hypothetical protein